MIIIIKNNNSFIYGMDECAIYRQNIYVQIVKPYLILLAVVVYRIRVRRRAVFNHFDLLSLLLIFAYT